MTNERARARALCMNEYDRNIVSLLSKLFTSFSPPSSIVIDVPEGLLPPLDDAPLSHTSCRRRRRLREKSKEKCTQPQRIRPNFPQEREKKSPSIMFVLFVLPDPGRLQRRPLRLPGRLQRRNLREEVQERLLLPLLPLHQIRAILHGEFLSRSSFQK